MLTLAAWLHDIDPFAVKFPDGFFLPGIRWYGLAYLMAFAFGYFFARRIARVGNSTVRKSEVMDFVITIAIGVVAGGRLGYVFFYKPALLITFPGKFPFWGVFQLNEGGMSSHGGMIGVGLACLWFAWRSGRPRQIETKLAGPSEATIMQRIDERGKLLDHTRCAKCNYDLHSKAFNDACPECGTPVKKSFSMHHWLHLFDITTVAASIGFLLGRIANFINAELIGRPCAEDLAWAVKYPQELFDVSNDWISSGKPQAILKLAPAAEQVGVEPIEWVNAVATKDVAFVEGTIRKMIDAVQDGGSRGKLVGDSIAPLLQAHHPSQLYAAFTEGLIVFVLLMWAWRKPRKPGVITGLFGAYYGVMRIFNEFYRTPDAHIADQEFAALQLTRGQLLSVVLTIAGIILAWWSSRRDLPALGGWRALPVVKVQRAAA